MMIRDELEQLMISAVFDEASPAEKQKLDTWLKDHPDDQQTFNELRETRSMLNEADEPVMIPTSPRALDIVHCDSNTQWKPWWKRGAVAVAACLLALFCISQGVVVQVGTLRLAMGPAASTEAVRKVIQQELASSYIPTVSELTGKVEQARSDWELIATRHVSLERSVQFMAALRDDDIEMQRRSFEQLIHYMKQQEKAQTNRLIRASFIPPSTQKNNSDVQLINNQNETDLFKEFDNDTH